MLSAAPFAGPPGAWFRRLALMLAAAVALSACAGAPTPTAPPDADLSAALVAETEPQAAVAPEGACAGLELGHTFGSPEALAQSFLAALAENDLDELLRFALHEAEFACHVWPYLPASRPERGLPLDFVWGDLNQKSLNALGFTRYYYGGRRLTLHQVSFAGPTTDFGPFVVHADTRLTVSDDQGRTGTVSLFGSIMESRGRFKLFSYVTD